MSTNPVSREQRNTPHRAAVITPGRVFYGNGETAELPPGVERSFDLILMGTIGRFHDQACIVVDGVDPAAMQPIIGRRAEGWTAPGDTGRGAWTTFTRGDRLVMVGIRAAMAAKHQHFTLFGPDTDPGATAMLLDRYHQVAGLAWRGNPAMTSVALMRSTWGNGLKEPLWCTRETPAGYAGPLIWSRDLNAWERDWGWVHTFDANGAYLGAAGNAELAWGPLHHEGPQAFDPKAPGYWKIRPSDELLDWPTRPPFPVDHEAPPLLPKLAKDGTCEVTTPYGQLLAELGGFEVVDSYTARAAVRSSGNGLHPAGVRILRKWSEALRDARTAVESWPAGGLRDGVLSAVKHTYTDTVGFIAPTRAGTGRRVQRHDWSHTTIDLWRATMLRKIILVWRTQGVWPVAVNVDAVSYADSVENPRTLATAIGVRPGLGGWKHTATVSTSEWPAARPVRAVGRRSRVGAP